MSIAPPSLHNALPMGRRLWRVRGHGISCHLTEWEVIELAHHFAKIRCRSCPTDCRISVFDHACPNHPDEWIDARDLHNGLFRDEASARLAHGFQGHPLGHIARGLLDTQCPDALRASQWDLKLPIGGDLVRAPQTIAAALRLLVRLGCAERLPVPKRCPRYRLLPAHA